MALQPYFRPRENLKLESQREIFVLRTKINHIRASFCSSKDIKTCDKCQCEVYNEHLYKYTKGNKKIINYNHISNGTVIGKELPSIS